MYSIYKDSLLNAENQKAIADMQTKYDVEKKDQQIKLQQSELLRRNILLINWRPCLYCFYFLVYPTTIEWSSNNRPDFKEEIMKQQDFATKAVIEAEENERKRIGSDLHDGARSTDECCQNEFYRPLKIGLAFSQNKISKHMKNPLP